MTTRRGFLRCAAAGWLVGPLQALAQAPGKVYRIGYLIPRTSWAAVDDAFLRGLRERGLVVGRDVVIEYRWAGNDVARLQSLADDLVRSNVDVIVTPTTNATRAAMQATRTIPIVMMAVPDPQGSGLVASLGRPGGNVTGVSIVSTDLARKRMQLIHELVPTAKRIGILGLRSLDSPPGTAIRSASVPMLAEMQAAAQLMGIDLVVRMIASRDELPDSFAYFRNEQAQGLIVQFNPLTHEHRVAVTELAARHQLPAVYEVRNFVDAGGFVSYGPDLQESFRRAASYVDRILRGSKPGELAIEQPTKFELVINLKTAKALGLTIPQVLMLRADEVIQ